MDPATVNEIGPAPSKIPNLKHHSCTALSGRDTARFGAALANHPKSTTLRSALAGQKTKELCITGVQNCNRQCLVMIASDSLYDISPAMLAKAMKKKGCQIVWAVLWCPHYLLCPDGDYENDIFHVRIENGIIIMDFKDSAFAYKHKLAYWRAWAYGCSYSDKKFYRDAGIAIVWETIQSWGPFKMIQITRVHDMCEVVRPLPLRSTMVAVPNFNHIIDVVIGAKTRHWMFGSKNLRHAKRLRVIARAIAEAPKIWLPREFFSKILQFGYNRKDNDVERNILGAAITARASRIEVDAFVLQHGLKLGGVEHRDLTTALMMIITAGRQVQTQLISKVLNKYKEGPPSEGFFTSIWHEIFGDDKNPFGNIAGLSAAARVMAGDGPLTDLIANCVDEGYRKHHIISHTNAKKCGKLINTFTGRGGNGVIEACGCVTEGKDWAMGPNWCVHGVPYAGKHTEMVPIEDVDCEDNYVAYSNLDKSASVHKIFETYSEGKILNSCAAPGNDGNYGFNRSNHSSKYLDRVQPNGQWDLDGNVHCEKCQLAMGYNCPNQFLDYGSPCEYDYFHPELLSEDWNKGNKIIIKVQKGLELAKNGKFPKQFVGYFIAPVKANGAELYVANFQGNKSWQEIKALPKDKLKKPAEKTENKPDVSSLPVPTVINGSLARASSGNNKPTSGQDSTAAEGTANATPPKVVKTENKPVSIPGGAEGPASDLTFGFEVNTELVSQTWPRAGSAEEIYSDHNTGTTDVTIHVPEETVVDKYKPISELDSYVAEGTANANQLTLENIPNIECQCDSSVTQIMDVVEGEEIVVEIADENKPTSECEDSSAEGTANVSDGNATPPQSEDLGSDDPGDEPEGDPHDSEGEDNSSKAKASGRSDTMFANSMNAGILFRAMGITNLLGDDYLKKKIKKEEPVLPSLVKDEELDSDDEEYDDASTEETTVASEDSASSGIVEVEDLGSDKEEDKKPANREMPELPATPPSRGSPVNSEDEGFPTLPSLVNPEDLDSSDDEGGEEDQPNSLQAAKERVIKSRDKYHESRELFLQNRLETISEERESETPEEIPITAATLVIPESLSEKPRRSRERVRGSVRKRELNPRTLSSITSMDSSTICRHNFPKEPGCPGCLPPFKRTVYHGEWGVKWYDPQTETECFASAMLGRPATRTEIPLLTCIQSAREPKKLEAYNDPSRYDFLSDRIIQLLAAAMNTRIVIDYVNDNTTVSYGTGFTRYLRLENGHFTRYHNPCHECALGELFLCNEKHVVEWEKIHVSPFEITTSEMQAIRRELTREKRYVKHHTPIVKYLERERHNKGFDINMIVGVAGSGKTYTAMKMLRSEEELTVIVPTKELKSEYEEKYSRPGLKTEVWSHFCRDPTTVKAILIDEIFMQHPLVVAIAAKHCEVLYAIGDPDQNDYGGKNTSRVIGHISRSINKAQTQIKCSRSVPLDVCRAIHGLSRGQISLKTHSTVQRSLFPVMHRKPSAPENGMCFLNIEEVPNVWKTVNKMQGARFKNGTIYLDRGFTASLHLEPPRSVYVGLTRHTQRLDIYCRSSDTFTIFDFHHTCHQGGRVRRAIEGSTEFEQTSISIAESFTSRKRAQVVKEIIDGEEVQRVGTKFDVAPADSIHCTVPESFALSNFIFDQTLLPSTQPFHETNDVDEEPEEDELIHSYVGHLGASFADAEEVLEKISPTNSQIYQAERDLEFGYLGKNFAGKKLSLQIPDQVQKSKALHLVGAARVRGRACKSSDYCQTVQTVLGRYSKDVDLATGEEARAAGDKLFEGLCKALPNGVQKISDEEFANAQAAQIDRIAAKKESQEGVFGDGYENTEKISFFLKQQTKSDLKANSWLRGGDDGYTYNLKAGQGVSAQPKAINHIVGAWVTAAERKITEALDPRIILGYGRSPAHLRKKLKRMMLHNKIADEVLCCDISEQDTSKGEWTNWYMRRLYRACGVPEKIIDLIECANINWRLDGNGVRLKVKHKYQSGRSDTLFANTMMNLGLIFSSVDIVNLKIALFQGDDSYVRAGRVRLVNECPNLKIERGPFGDFIGFLIGEDDIFLDLPRFAVKLMNRTFASDQEINEYRVAVYDWLRVFQDAQQLYLGLKLNAAKYDTSEEDMAVLFDFLRQFYLGNLFRKMGKSYPDPQPLKSYKMANPNCVMTEIMPIPINVSERKIGPLSTMADLNIY